MAQRRQRAVISALAAAVVSGLLPCTARAWDAAGHQQIGAVAEQLLRPKARAHVAQLLGPGITLAKAGPWLDCVRSVVMDGGQARFDPDPAHPEYDMPCVPFESRAGIARMEAYAAANWRACAPDEHAPCHGHFHYTDVPPLRQRYRAESRGASANDVVHALNAALARLQHRAVPAPFVLADDTDALLVLIHLVGDVHQPLHAGALWLAPDGQTLDPDAPAPHGSTDWLAGETRGGNNLIDGDDQHGRPRNLHVEWDVTGYRLNEGADPALVAVARQIAPLVGPPAAWPEAWASDSIRAAGGAFAGMTFTPGPRPGTWWFHAPAGYAANRIRVQQARLALAAARLAQVLNALWG